MKMDAEIIFQPPDVTKGIRYVWGKEKSRIDEKFIF